MSMYEPLFRHVLFPAYESALRGRHTLAYLQEYERSQWMDPEQLEQLQWQKLRRLIRHCWDEVPFYRERWRHIGLGGPEDVRNPADYARLPVLTKQDIRDNLEQLVAPSRRDGLLYKSTGGSTGEPMRFGYTRESYERRIAVMFRGYGWAGARLGQRTLYLWGASLSQPLAPRLKDRVYHGAFNRRVLNAFQMSESRMQEYADAIAAFRPEVIVSYVAPILRLAEWALANNRKLHRPRLVLGAAESLHDAQRDIIEQAFGCPAYNTYGCREFMLIASECKHRNGLHVNADHLKVELGPGLVAGVEGGPREVIATDLHNYGMPMLRYVNGDLATLGGGRCPCGLGLPLLARVDGRKLDALRTADGHFVPGEYIVYIFLNAVGVKRYQVVQRCLETLDVALVVDRAFDESVLEMLRDQMAKVVGSSIAMNFRFVEDIPLTPSGKLRVTISELA